MGLAYIPANFSGYTNEYHFIVPQDVPSPFLAAQPFVTVYNTLSDIHNGILDTPALFFFLCMTLPFIVMLMLNEPHVIPYWASASGHDKDPVVRARAREIKPLTRRLWLGFYVLFLIFQLMEVYLVVPAYCAYVWFLATYPAPTWIDAAIKWFLLGVVYFLWALLGFAMGLYVVAITFLGTRELALGGRRARGRNEGKYEDKAKEVKMV